MKTTLSTLTLLCVALILSPELLAQVTLEERSGKIIAKVSGRPVIQYHAETENPPRGMESVYARSGFIHPVYSPSGKVLTDAFPIGHVHQHAVFNAWTRATFNHEVVDFWNQHKKLGTVEHKNVIGLTENAFEVALQQISLKTGPAIDEQWRVSVQDSADPFIIDIEIQQSCATPNEIYLHPYHYGGFGFRGSPHWSPEDTTHYEGSMKVLTGDGIRDIKDSNHTTPRWVAVYGKIAGESAGLVIMDHPANFRYPQPVRVHPKMPYFVFSPVVKGSFIIKPGLSYKARYRIATFDGEPDPRELERWYQNYLENESDFRAKKDK